MLKLLQYRLRQIIIIDSDAENVCLWTQVFLSVSVTIKSYLFTRDVQDRANILFLWYSVSIIRYKLF